MNTQKHYTIVVGFDFSDQGNLALDKAFAMADEKNADVHVATGIHRSNNNETFPDVPLTDEGVSTINGQILKFVVGMTTKYPKIHNTYIHTWKKKGSTTILGVANETQADLILCGTHSKKGLKRVVLGSVSESIVRHAHCPVLIIRDKDYQEHCIPEVEPACPRCLANRAATKGFSWWCDDHDHARPYPSPLRSIQSNNIEQARQDAFILY